MGVSGAQCPGFGRTFIAAHDRPQCHTSVHHAHCSHCTHLIGLRDMQSGSICIGVDRNGLNACTRRAKCGTVARACCAQVQCRTAIRQQQKSAMARRNSPKRFAVRITRRVISPRFATRICGRENCTDALPAEAVIRFGLPALVAHHSRFIPTQVHLPCRRVAWNFQTCCAGRQSTRAQLLGRPSGDVLPQSLHCEPASSCLLVSTPALHTSQPHKLARIHHRCGRIAHRKKSEGLRIEANQC